MKQPKILFFINGPVPSEKDYEEAAEIGVAVSYRNTLFVGGVAAEPCDGVAGDVPKEYKKFPTAKQAVAKWKDAIKKAKAALPDVSGAPIVEQQQTQEPSKQQTEPDAKPAWGGMPKGGAQ